MSSSHKTHDELVQEVRDTASLPERLNQCMDRISTMCSKTHPPKMSIPVCASDDDFFITTTIDDALQERKQLLDDRDALAKLANAWNERDRCQLDDDESDEPADNTARRLEAAEEALREAWRAASGALQRAKGVPS